MPIPYLSIQIYTYDNNDNNSNNDDNDNVIPRLGLFVEFRVVVYGEAEGERGRGRASFSMYIETHIPIYVYDNANLIRPGNRVTCTMYITILSDVKAIK